MQLGGATLNVLWWCVSKGLGFTPRKTGHSKKGALAEGKAPVTVAGLATTFALGRSHLLFS